MRDIVTAKWSLRPQRLVLGVVLIGMLLLTPQQCLGDDEPVTPTDSSQSQPAQQSPPAGGPAPAEPGSGSAATNHPAPRSDNAVMESSAQVRQGMTPNPGNCFECSRDHNSADDESCVDKDKTKLSSVQCPEGDPKTVRCVTIQAYHHGPRDKKLRDLHYQKRFNKRVEVKGCNYLSRGGQNVTTCVQNYLNFKLEDDKCYKGTYRISDVQSQPLNDFISCFYPGTAISNGLAKDRTEFKPKDKEEEAYFGKMGKEQYADIWICMCKGNECNAKHNKDALTKATQASATSLFKSFASGSIITFTLLVATASFLRLP